MLRSFIDKLKQRAHSIRVRIIISFSVIFILVVTMSTLTYSKMGTIAESDQAIAETFLPALIETTTINNQMLTINKQVNEAANTITTEGVQEIRAEVDQAVKDLDESRIALEPLIEQVHNEESKQAYLTFMSRWTAYKGRAYEILDLAESGDLVRAKEEAYHSIAYFDQANQSLMTIVESTKQLIESSVESSVLLNQTGMRGVIVISIIVALVTIAVIFYTVRLVIRPISLISEQVQTVAKGDFSLAPLPVQAIDELGMLTKHFNQMTTTMRTVLTKVLQNASYVGQTSNQVVQQTQETKEGVTEVAHAIATVSADTQNQQTGMAELTTYMDDISNHMQNINHHIESVTSLATVAKDKARLGNNHTHDMINNMNHVGTKTEAAEAQMDALDTQFKKMEQITTVIQGFSSQTNLLALNATIEAERAGEAGKSFGVVADEVRKLAIQSAASTKQIEALILELQEKTKETVEAMQEVNQLTINSKQDVTNVANSLTEITDTTTEVEQKMQAIVTNILDVTAKIEKGNTIIRDVEVTSKQTTTNAEMVAGSSQEASAAMEEVSAALQNLATKTARLQSDLNQFIVH